MVLRNTKLRNAILFALAAGATSMAGTGAAFAQAQDQNQGQASQSQNDQNQNDQNQNDQEENNEDEQVTQLGTVTVTGSRLGRATLEGALPVIKLTREQIDASGAVSVSSFLRTVNVNSAGQFRPQSGSSAQAGAFANLRGLGGNRTLVLIDGHRAPTAPFAASSGTDLNAIPLAAVQSIEVLTSGASAIYGSDAVGGVINIITRKDFNGAQVTYGQSFQDIAPTKHMSALWGASNDDSNIFVGFAKSSREMAFTKDMPFPYVKGASTYGNNYLSVDPVTGELVNSRAVNGIDVFNPVVDGCNAPNFYISPANGRCVYDYNATAANMASISRRSLFANGQTQINDDWLAYFSASVTNTKSFGRYAPTPGFVVLGPDSAGNPMPGAITYLYHRYVGAGPRVNDTSSKVYDALIGVEGNVADYTTLELGVHYNDYRYDEWGRNYIVGPLAVQAINNGSLDYAHPLQNDAAVLNGIKATITRNSIFNTKAAFGNLTFNNLFSLSGGPASLVVGGEYRKLDYSDTYDSLSSAGVILGSSGASSGQARRVSAGYFELLVPFTTSFSADLAARYTRYSDFGSAFSPKLSLRWQPIQSLTFRGSIGQGFIAPSLDVISQATAFSADSIVDPATCAFQGYSSTEECSDAGGVQVDSYREKAVGLGPEESTQYNLGVVWDATDWLNFEVGLWKIEITDRIAYYSSQDLIDINLGNDPTPFPGAPCSIERDPNRGGAVVEIHNCYFNEGQVNLDGVDFTTRLNFDLGGAGQVLSVLNASYMHEYTIDGGADQTMTQGLPGVRATLRNHWERGIWGANLNVRYIGPNGHGASTTKHYTTYNLHGEVQLPWNATLTVGVNNLTDELPELIGYDGRPYNFYLYNPYGRTPYVNYTQRF